MTAALGEPEEKQFCRLGGDRTLLQRSVARMGPLTDGTTVVVRGDRLELARGQLRGVASIVAQPGDRGIQRHEDLLFHRLPLEAGWTDLGDEQRLHAYLTAKGASRLAESVRGAGIRRTLPDAPRAIRAGRVAKECSA